MHTFLIAVEDYHGETKADAERFECKYSAVEYAAEQYIEDNYCELEYPSESTVNVWDKLGNKSQWVVTAEPSTVFSSIQQDTNGDLAE